MVTVWCHLPHCSPPTQTWYLPIKTNRIMSLYCWKSWIDIIQSGLHVFIISFPRVFWAPYLTNLLSPIESLYDPETQFHSPVMLNIFCSPAHWVVPNNLNCFTFFYLCLKYPFPCWHFDKLLFILQVPAQITSLPGAFYVFGSLLNSDSTPVENPCQILINKLMVHLSFCNCTLFTPVFYSINTI